MNELLSNFEFNGKQLTVVEENGKTLFVAKDICEILDLGNVTMALQKLDEDEKLTSIILRSGQNRKLNFVNEAGLYNLIFSSNKPEAKIFKRWVTHEVLPSIRTKGYYINEQHPNVFKTLESILGIETANRLELQNEASLQVKHGFGFHDPDYICQFEAKEEFGIHYSEFLYQLRRRRWIHHELEPYQGTYWRARQRILGTFPTELGSEDNLVQTARNVHLISYKNSSNISYCVRVKRQEFDLIF